MRQSTATARFITFRDNKRATINSWHVNHCILCGCVHHILRVPVQVGLKLPPKTRAKTKIWHFLLLKLLKSLLGTGCCRSRVCVHSLWLCFPSCAYLWDLCCLILLQLLLEAIVWADKGANSFDRRQTLVPAVVGDGHEVSHHHGCTAGHTCKATAKKEHGWSLS